MEAEGQEGGGAEFLGIGTVPVNLAHCEYVYGVPTWDWAMAWAHWARPPTGGKPPSHSARGTARRLRRMGASYQTLCPERAKLCPAEVAPDTRQICQELLGLWTQHPGQHERAGGWRGTHPHASACSGADATAPGQHNTLRCRCVSSRRRWGDGLRGGHMGLVTLGVARARSTRSTRGGRHVLETTPIEGKDCKAFGPPSGLGYRTASIRCG